MKRAILAAVLALLFLPLCAFKGCTNWEKTTYQALAASQQTFNDAQAAYEVSAATGNCTAALAATPPVPCIPHTAALTLIFGFPAVLSTIVEVRRELFHNELHLPKLFTPKHIGQLYEARVTQDATNQPLYTRR